MKAAAVINGSGVSKAVILSFFRVAREKLYGKSEAFGSLRENLMAMPVIMAKNPKSGSIKQQKYSWNAPEC